MWRHRRLEMTVIPAYPDLLLGAAGSREPNFEGAPLGKHLGRARCSSRGRSGVRSELHHAQTPAVLDHSRAPRAWPARHGCSVGRLCQLEASTPATCSTMLSPVSSQMSTRKAKWVLVFMDKSDSTRPGPLVTRRACAVFSPLSNISFAFLGRRLVGLRRLSRVVGLRCLSAAWA